MNSVVWAHFRHHLLLIHRWLSKTLIIDGVNTDIFPWLIKLHNELLAHIS